MERCPRCGNKCAELIYSSCYDGGRCIKCAVLPTEIILGLEDFGNHDEKKLKKYQNKCEKKRN